MANDEHIDTASAVPSLLLCFVGESCRNRGQGLLMEEHPHMHMSTPTTTREKQNKGELGHCFPSRTTSTIRLLGMHWEARQARQADIYTAVLTVAEILSFTNIAWFAHLSAASIVRIGDSPFLSESYWSAMCFLMRCRTQDVRHKLDQQKNRKRNGQTNTVCGGCNLNSPPLYQH